MARYSVLLQRTAGTTVSVGSMTGGATLPRRQKIVSFMLGSEAAVADNVFLWQIQRVTAAGTSTAVTPQALDPADAAAVFLAGQNHTAEPTYTAGAVLASVPLNQRSTFRWVAAPGEELTAPATTAAGFGVKTPTATAVVITADFKVDEQ